MSYLRSNLLTLFGLVSFLAPAAYAQRDVLKRELDGLSSPVANERAAAVLRIANIEEDISADMRVAYKFGDSAERIGLINAAQIRKDTALVEQAALALSEDDEQLRGQAREYLLKLDFAALMLDESELSATQAEAWADLVTFRIRRDIGVALIEAHLLPGKFVGQFDELRRFDAGRLDRELLAVLTAEPGFAEPLNMASQQVLDGDVPAERAFQVPWRRLQTAAGAFVPAIEYLHEMNENDAAARGIRIHGRQAWYAALEVFSGVRCAAVRALAESPNVADVADALGVCYGLIMQQQPAPELMGLVNQDELETEIEVALAMFGDDRLLTARIEGLRAQIQRVADAQQNVNMQVAQRPDLIAQNQIAHLLLRAGDAEKAEAEWAAAVEAGLAMLGNADGRNRNSLSSFLAAAYYNLACAQSLQSKASKGLASLREAVRYGYKDYGWMLDDGDLEAVRTSAEFRRWFDDNAPPSVADRLLDRD